MEQITFFTRLGQAIMGASRAIYLFKSCGHCTLGRKVLIRFITFINGANTLKRIHRAVREDEGPLGRTRGVTPLPYFVQ